MVKVVEFEQVGGPEQLRLVEQPITPPAIGEVQVKVKAAGLNRAELLFLAGRYLVQPKLPAFIGFEASGIVQDFGKSANRFSIGQAVSITPNFDPTLHGAIGQVVNIPTSAIQPKPDGVSFIDAAAFWMAYPTAWGGLVQTGGLTMGSGQTVLVTAASSSVGIAAIQIAKNYGATVIATTRTTEKLDAIRSIGPDHIIVTDDEELVEQVHVITQGNGFDIAFDPIGGSFVEKLAVAAGRNAVIVEYGMLSGESSTLPFFAMITKGLSIKVFHLSFDLLQHTERLRVAINHLLPRLKDGTYVPVIDRTYPLERIREAYAHMASNRQFGKIMLQISDT